MADNKTSFSTLTTKQKVIGALVVVIFGFIIYEVIGLFSSGDSAPDQMKPLPQASSAQPKLTTAAATTTTTTTIQAPAGGAEAAPVQTIVTPVNAITLPKETTELQKQQTEQQQTYLDSVNQLQLLKIKREIAETNQAIASARLATETANKNMSDLLTQPTLPLASGGSFSGGVRPTSMPGSVQSMEQTTTDNVPALKPQVLDIPFTVVSVSMQFNRWNAVLGYDNKLYSVSAGDSLFDGSTVVSISKSGVVLLKDGKRRKISIQATI